MFIFVPFSLPFSYLFCLISRKKYKTKIKKFISFYFNFLIFFVKMVWADLQKYQHIFSKLHFYIYTFLRTSFLFLKFFRRGFEIELWEFGWSASFLYKLNFVNSFPTNRRYCHSVHPHEFPADLSFKLMSTSFQMHVKRILYQCMGST